MSTLNVPPRVNLAQRVDGAFTSGGSVLGSLLEEVAMAAASFRLLVMMATTRSLIVTTVHPLVAAPVHSLVVAPVRPLVARIEVVV
jgi:hypothetical protein